jgi:hypothetical protein
MLNIIRIAKVVALLAFVLPWVAVSCRDVDLATASGIDLIQGTMTQNPQAAQQLSARFGQTEALSVEDLPGEEAASLDINLFALGAAIVIIVGLALTFIGGAKAAARNALVSSLLGAALAFGATWQFREAVKAESMQGQSPGAAGSPFDDMSAMGGDILDSMLQDRFGYWILLAALLTAAGASALTLVGAQAQRPQGAAAE